MSDLERRRACVRARPRRSNKENGPFSRAAGFSRKLCFFYYHLLRCFFLDVVSYEPVLYPPSPLPLSSRHVVHTFVVVLPFFLSSSSFSSFCFFFCFLFIFFIFFFHFGSGHAHAPVVSLPHNNLCHKLVDLILHGYQPRVTLYCTFLVSFRRRNK